MLSLDLIGGVAFKLEDKIAFSQLHKAVLTFDYQPVKWITVFVGPTFNINIVNYDQNYLNIAYNSVYKDSFNGGEINTWVGGQFGIRM